MRAAGRGWRRFVPELCFGAYAAAVAVSAVKPHSPATWLTENAPAWIIVLVMVMTRRSRRFSDRTYVQGLLFLLVHTYGSHFTYPQAPLGEWAIAAAGFTRNHFDRLAHVAFGLLLFAPLRELLFRREPRRRLASELVLTLGVASMIGVGYELLEWGSAVFVGEQAVADFLGTQGDAWDAQGDLLCNLLGALLAAAVETVLAARGDGDPARS